MALVTEKLVDYVSLKTGDVNLYDLALLSDALTIKTENEARIHEFYSKKDERR